jgi:sulfatase maturation enzyme AslB (radical SAM superfamily)
MCWEQIKAILEKEFLCSNEFIDGIDLLGGEPLMNYDVIPKICNWVWLRFPNTKIFVRTNGTLLNDTMKLWFQTNKSKISLGLSLDGTPETNAINRGRGTEDLNYFVSNWPEVPIKVTIFPDSVGFLSESIKYLYQQGAKVIASLAQGVMWNKNSTETLARELSILTSYYLESSTRPIEPLYDLNFDKAFWLPQEDIQETPCWQQANIHAYDCDGEVLPCHMFSKIVQGAEKRAMILSEYKQIRSEQLPKGCIICPIRWCCKNCMALNYQHNGDFGNNINVNLMCEAQMIAAEASAEYIVRNFDLTANIKSVQDAEKISNAIKFLKLRHSNEEKNY